MKKLVFVTILWAFSFSLIGEFLAGKIDSYFAVVVRVTLASLVFLPFTKFKGVSPRLALSIMAIGAAQIGVMYLFYYNSFLYLSVTEVALFTIFTPFYVTIIYDAFKIRFRPLYLLSVGVAVLGAFIIKYDSINDGFLKGFLLVQGANICFGFGQSAYKALLERYDVAQKGIFIFGYFHFGALLITLVAFLIFGNFDRIILNWTQVAVLLWLGIVASGLGYFLWNSGACEVDSGVLAIMNNALIPAAIVVNLVFWYKDTDMLRLILGAGVLCISLIIHKKIVSFYEVKAI
ncbi:EamA family transporter [Campylobacter sp. faydin G-24]|uniref:EamA family transporter n=1 Tax=Campylobacter anatolicus TaxID=2829105 RepID=A0ABS5HIC4_9BACT|nr:EamA family transporter [Campylobacter anatolicus]MBR8464010.1 EamA family transporter [Campylobacter anatolicus]MBR8465802.1 EamA family transporter [Campylobacter anatolicus]